MNSKTEIIEFKFESKAFDILPGNMDYHCVKHGLDLKCNNSFYNDVGTIKENVQIKDICVEENKVFNYQIVKPVGICNTKKVIFLFHGFNEKDWTKYMPWANKICEGTGCSIILFPIAFHMQRAPKDWSDKREMYKLSEKRKLRHPNIVHSSLSNVAISMRLHSMPQRFIWSGLQTYYDVVQLIEEFKKGGHPFVNKDFEFDIFAYSIGGFLAQVLKLTNHNNYFSNSKVCLFCSGATFNRLSPVSKFILDSETNVALYSFLVEHFDKILEKDNLLNHYFNEDHFEGKVFYSMLDYQKGRALREKLLKVYEKHFYAITLAQDTVIPSFEVTNTLKGAYRDINIKIYEFDFNREYTHENPFPSGNETSEQIEGDFNEVFEKVCDFLNNTHLE